MDKRDKNAMTVMTATRIIAMWNVTRAPEKQDPEYQLRQMSRWYAREFNYKLHEVDEVPIETIAMHYWEDYYQNLPPEDREEEMNLLVSSEEDLENQKKADDEFLAKTIREAQEAAKKGRDLADRLKKLGKPADVVRQPTAEEIKAELNQPVISMQFVDPKELEAQEEWDILGDTSPKK